MERLQLGAARLAQTLQDPRRIGHGTGHDFPYRGLTLPLGQGRATGRDEPVQVEHACLRSPGPF